MRKTKAVEEEGRTHISLKDVEAVLKTIFSEEDLRLYKDLGNGFYELPRYVITNKKGLEMYLKELEGKQNEID